MCLSRGSCIWLPAAGCLGRHRRKEGELIGHSEKLHNGTTKWPTNYPGQILQIDIPIDMKLTLGGESVGDYSELVNDIDTIPEIEQQVQA